MAYDLIGLGRSLTSDGWRSVLQTAEQHGWQPMGTLPPWDWNSETSGEWSGTYFGNDFQRVTAEDATAIADALIRAATILEPEPDDPLAEQSDPFHRYPIRGEIAFLTNVANMIRNQSFRLG